MESWGSLEFGTTYSLFMPLANCDLMEYMESRTQPQSFGEKAAFVKCAVDLAGAIDFLHEQLVSPNYEKLSCFHMDLKPQNILVVIRDGVHTWKLSDFNMSRVKGRKNPGLQPNRSPTFYDINKLFKQEKPIVPTSSLADSTVNRRGTGTYLAPEACIGDAVQAESDIWSLGCVITIVFTYMCKGFSGVKSFSELRSSKSRDLTDCFFTLWRKRDLPKISDAVLNDGVTRWLKQLRTTQPTDSEKAILEDLTRFLEKQVFVIDPARRKSTTADQIRHKLVNASNGYRRIPEPRFEPPTSPRPRLIFEILRSPTRVNSSTISRPIRLNTNLDPPLVTCVLGSDACPLVCATSRKLKAFQVHHITSEVATDNLTESESVSPLNLTLSWSKHVAVSTQYVLAATDDEEFEVR
jgi:serine/threonine protein kinase